MVVECKIYCFNLSEVQRGLPEKSFWVPFVLNFNHVSAVKAYVDEQNEISTDMSVVYIDHREVYVLNIPFEQACDLYKKCQNEIRCTIFN